MIVGRAWVILLLVGAVGHSFGADNAAQEGVRQALLYGIDSQVMDAIQVLQTSGDTAYTTELTQIITDQRSPLLQAAVFDLFRQQKIDDGVSAATKILAGWQDAQSSLVISAVRYLAAVHGAGVAAAAAPLVGSPDNALSLAAIQALGDAGDASSAALLVEKLKNPDFPGSRKPDIILALGTLRDAASLDELLSIASSPDEDKVNRMYAADALGKLGDAKALPVLRAMFAESDALIRLYAASALTHFSLDEVFPILLQGLRDENLKVREQSAKALGQRLSDAQAAAAVPILSYKAELDPERIVRVAAIQALGEIGGDEAMKLLLKIYSGNDHPLESRETALGILIAKDLSTSLTAIRKVVSDEWKSFDQRTLESTAKALSTVKSPDIKDVLAKFLDSPDAVVRSYGARGIGLNGFSDLKDRIKTMADTDPNMGTRREAANSLAKL